MQQSTVLILWSYYYLVEYSQVAFVLRGALLQQTECGIDP